jgi:hypothetical protein
MNIILVCGGSEAWEEFFALVIAGLTRQSRRRFSAWRVTMDHRVSRRQPRVPRGTARPGDDDVGVAGVGPPRMTKEKGRTFVRPFLTFPSPLTGRVAASGSEQPGGVKI